MILIFLNSTGTANSTDLLLGLLGQYTLVKQIADALKTISSTASELLVLNSIYDEAKKNMATLSAIEQDAYELLINQNIGISSKMLSDTALLSDKFNALASRLDYRLNEASYLGLSAKDYMHNERIMSEEV